MKELRDVIAGVQRAAASHEPMSLATVVRIEGSAYRRPGARLLVGPEGARVGSISGGCLEADVVSQAMAARRAGAARLVRYDLRGKDDVVFGFGLGCDGAVDVLVEPLPRGEMPAWMAEVGRRLEERKPAVLATAVADDPDRGLRLGQRRLLPACASSPSPAWVLEPIEPPPALWVFGGGEDARVLASLAHDVGLLVTVVDPSPSRASRDRFPHARIERRHPGGSLADMPIDPWTGVVLMTHRYESDREWLAVLATRPAGYIGVLGPRRRTERLRADLGHRGVTATRGLFAPAGLDIGAEGPEQIALAILAEMTAVLAGRAGGHLRERHGPLHETVESGVA